MRQNVLQVICLVFFGFSFINGFTQFVHQQPLPTNTSQPVQTRAAAAAAFPIDACFTYTFRIQIGDASADNHINDIGGNSYQVGYTTINGNQQDGLLQQLDLNGQVVWSKTFGSATLNERIHRIERYNSKSYVTLSKYTPALTLLWNRSFAVNPNHAEWQALESKDGSFFIWYQDDGYSSYELRLLKIDAAGNVLWNKGYDPASMSIGYEGSACQDDDYLYTANQSVASAYTTLITKIEKTTGNVIWAKTYKEPDYQNNCTGSDTAAITSLCYRPQVFYHLILPYIRTPD